MELIEVAERFNSLWAAVLDAWRWVDGKPCVPTRDNSGPVVRIRCGGEVRLYVFDDFGDAAQFEASFLRRAGRAAA